MKKIWLWLGVGLVVIALVFLGLKVFKPGVKPELSDLEGSATVVSGSFDANLKEAADLETRGELIAARDLYKNIVSSFASRPDIENVEKKLQDLNMRIILSAINVPGQTEIRQIKEGDSLSMIADEYHTTSELIKRENGLSSDVIKLGQRLRIWTGKFSVVVDKSQNILTLYSNDEVMKVFKVSTGKNNTTPVGTFKIVNKLVNPSWTHEGQVIPAGDKRNILGTRWMGFDIPGYGIHGTTEPESIGQQATAGCVRMLNNEVELLYDLLPVNTEVTVID